VTVTGKVLQLKGTLATATVAQLWTSSLAPATFLYGHFWSDQICYLQRITAGGSIIDKIAADQPKTFPGYSACLPSASTTPITGGTEPTAVALASLYLGNYSGTTLNYALSLIL
jgi:hypothetical protein